MDLVVLVPFYNDFKALQRLMMSLSQYHIPSILCDGRFYKFKKLNESDLSTDGSRFLASAFEASLIQCAPCLAEQKINKMLAEAAKLGYDYAILLGCDEYPQGDFKTLESNLKKLSTPNPTIFKVPFYDDKTQRSDFLERIFFMPGLIRARGSIDVFYSASDEVQGNHKPMTSEDKLCDVTIHQDNSIRTKERNQLMREYQKFMSTS